MRPLYILVGFWGDRFRSYFLDFCLPSLLSQNNLGFLSREDGHKLLVATTVEDWRELEASPLWAKLSNHVTPTLIPVGLPEDSSDAGKFRHMTEGHRLLVNVTLRDRALACQVMPDAMYTDGTIATALSRASQGADAVLTVAMRLKEETLFRDLRTRNLLPARASEPQTIRLGSRDVVDLAIKHLYDDCLLHDWDGGRFLRFPAFAFWRARCGGILIHSAYFAYILFDTAKIVEHNERSFDMACIENYWLSDNYPDPSRISIVEDSDDALVVSWTPTAPYIPPPTLPSWVHVLGLSWMWKGYRMRCMREYHVSIGDVQKANNVRFPIYWHREALDAGPHDSEDWSVVRRRANSVMFWFFGDVFPEFGGKERRQIVLLAARLWWSILRLAVRLAPIFDRVSSRLNTLMPARGRSSHQLDNSSGLAE
jgi:hypothetical protein